MSFSPSLVYQFGIILMISPSLVYQNFNYLKDFILLVLQLEIRWKQSILIQSHAILIKISYALFVDLLETYLPHLPDCVLSNTLSKENEHQISL